MSVRAHRTEGVTGSNGRGGTNGVGGGIRVGGGNEDRKGAGGRNRNRNVNVNGDDETGALTGVEANEETQYGDARRSGAGTGMEAEIRGRTQHANGVRSEDGNESSGDDGNGDKDGNGDGNEDGIEEAGREAKKR